MEHLTLPHFKTSSEVTAIRTAWCKTGVAEGPGAVLCPVGEREPGVHLHTVRKHELEVDRDLESIRGLHDWEWERISKDVEGTNPEEEWINWASKLQPFAHQDALGGWSAFSSRSEWNLCFFGNRLLWSVVQDVVRDVDGT